MLSRFNVRLGKRLAIKVVSSRRLEMARENRVNGNPEGAHEKAVFAPTSAKDKK